MSGETLAKDEAGEDIAPRSTWKPKPKAPELPTPPPEDAPPKERKNQKRVDAARKAGEASALRKREIHGAIATALPQELQTTWAKEGHKFMREQAERIRGIKDPINAAAQMSEAFMETYGSGAETAFGNEGDRYYKRAELEAAHAEEWADEQERKYYAAALADAQHAGEIDEGGELTAHGRAQTEPTPRPPTKPSDDDPPF